MDNADMDLPKWRLHESPGYDPIMADMCAAIATRIQADPAYRISLLKDPREGHSALFTRFAPAGHPEYAGTYRGTPGTSLEHRLIHAPGITDTTQFFAFTAPARVPAKTADLLATVNRERKQARGAGNYIQLLHLTHLFAWFGAIHPFLDGNGHIQRILFAAAAAELHNPTSNRFTIHPRSFDRLLAS